MITGKKGIDLIESFEGFSAIMYYDAVGLPTIGYGTLIDSADEEWLKKATISREQAEALLRKELDSIEGKVSVMTQNKINQNQFDALASFCYNLGVNNLKSSTLLKKVVTDPKDPTIRNEFMKWVHAGGKVLKGLEKRRQAEADLYFASPA